MGIHEKEMGPSSVFWAEETRNRAPVLELPVVSYAVGAAGFWRPKKKVPNIVFLVFLCLIYVQERREMGQTALETTLNELKHVLLLPIFFLPVTSSMI